MKILNLYSGLGGNRRLWKGHEVTAVEINESIAKFYADHFPEDKMIIGDAHQYLLEHYREFDYIWSSTPCPSHSRARFWSSRPGTNIKPIYPDLTLYEEILFLKHYFDGLWTVENVIPYYTPLVEPSVKLSRHYFWTNFTVSQINFKSNDPTEGKVETWQENSGFDISGYLFTTRRDKVLRNCVPPPIGQHILNCALLKDSELKVTQSTLF